MHLCLSDGAATPADAHVSDVYAESILDAAACLIVPLTQETTRLKGGRGRDPTCSSCLSSGRRKEHNRIL